MRPGVREGGLTTLVAPFAREHILNRARARHVSLFTAFPLGALRGESLTRLGIEVKTHGFEFTRATGRPLPLPQPRVVLGSARVTDGHMSAQTYLDWVATEAAIAPFTYLPHRRESDDTVGLVAQMAGVTVHRAEIPVELLLAGTEERLDVISLSSSALTTLARVLEPSGSTVRERRVRGAVVEVP